MSAAWYTYSRIDGYGGAEPYGNFPKPDSNILVPDGTAVTAPLAGVVSGINAPDGSTPAWGYVVTIRLTTPYNSVADHIAFLHMSSIAPGLHVGMPVQVGQLLGTAGSGQSTPPGTQPAALGFAFYHGDYYGYGTTWSQYVGSPQLNPVPFLDALKKNSPITPIPPTATNAPIASEKKNLTSLVTSPVVTGLSPNADVTQLLISLDQTMIIENPFASAPLNTSDPIGWITEVGGSAWLDSVAIGLRLLFLVVGGFILLRVINEFIDYGALIQAFTGGGA